jgi:hypothetical protein
MRIFANILAVIFLVFVTAADATTLPLPSNLISLSLPTGTLLFNRSYKSNYFWPLMIHFESQQNRTYCSIASSVIVLNALNVTPPTDEILAPFYLFTQNNFFTPAVTNILPAEKVKKSGATLAEISQALKTFSVHVQTFYADKIAAQQFRDIAKNVIRHNQGYIIVNFYRPGLHEDGGGHMSPLAAYDVKTDRFLLLDVARFRYAPVWVTTADLWHAMDTVDPDAKAYRGFVIIKPGV